MSRKPSKVAPNKGNVKGASMEEALRAYFLQSGYYAARGLCLRYREFDVTDVDIWLYERSSSVSRHRIIVDSKNKTTPKAIERILWAKGLQSTLSIEQAIVATTDRRPEIVEFGKRHDVLVLDGNFISKLVSGMSPWLQNRISEEELTDLLDAYEFSKMTGNWRAKLSTAKSALLTGLDYNSINFWLEEARYFAEQALMIKGHSETAFRALYIVASYIALAFDYILKDLAFIEAKERPKSISEGLRYGTGGQAGANSVLYAAESLAQRYLDGPAAHRIRLGLEADLGAVRSDILAEYFARNGVAQSLFKVACEFESFAYSRQFPPASALSRDAISLLGVLADYWRIDRSKLLGPPTSPAPMIAEKTRAADTTNQEAHEQERLL